MSKSNNKTRSEFIPEKEEKVQKPVEFEITDIDPSG